MFVKQPGHEKRRLVDFVLSNCSWKDGRITPIFRQPFDILAVAVTQSLDGEPADSGSSAKNEKWLPGMDSNHDSRLQRPLSYH
jgi:site-specific DNA recombinase